MLLIIPYIELIDGVVSNRICGESDKELYYEELCQDPLKMVELWRRENSKSLHLFDYDSFHSNDNTLNVNSLLYISQNIDIPIQVYSKLEFFNSCKILLDNGVYRIFIDELLFSNPAAVDSLIKEYSSSRICFALFSDNRNVVNSGLNKIISDKDYIEKIIKAGGRRIFYADINANHAEKCPDLGYIAGLAAEYIIKITLLDGVYSYNDLKSVSKYERNGIDSVILSTSLYKNRFPCQKIWRLIEADLEK
jgi:phosphoribosylformimino-5-aminoimidazole carboxamide ribotide isomerase